MKAKLKITTELFLKTNFITVIKNESFEYTNFDDWDFRINILTKTTPTFIPFRYTNPKCIRKYCKLFGHKRLDKLKN